MSRRRSPKASRTSVSGHRSRCRTITRPRTWAELLADYESEHAKREREEVRWFASQPSLMAAIHVSAAATNARGKRYDHQFRIRRTAVAAAAKILSANEALLRAQSSFHDLLAMIERLLLPVSGLGELYCYDCAARIGAYLGIEPVHVYLHSGTRIGARALKLSHKQPWLAMAELPSELQGRKPREVESILCIYAACFPRLTLS